MKKEYVKPIMESEEFVANEYVASCILITCNRSEGKCSKRTDKITGYTDIEAYLTATGGTSRLHTATENHSYYTHESGNGQTQLETSGKYYHTVESNGVCHSVTAVNSPNSSS